MGLICKDVGMVSTEKLEQGVNDLKGILDNYENFYEALFKKGLKRKIFAMKNLRGKIYGMVSNNILGMMH